MGHSGRSKYHIRINNVRSTFFSLFVISLLLVATVPAYAEAPVSSDSISTYIIVFNDTPGIQAASSKNAVSSFASSSGGAVKYKYNILNGMAVTIPDSAADQLSQLPNVKYVEKDGQCSALLFQAVPQIGADQVWAGGYDGTGIKVAVIDTGINASHPDLAGKVVAWVDFVNGNNATPYDDHGHGTHCAGIVAGTGAASSGLVKGVAPGASLMGAKVLDSTGNGWNSDIIQAMDWAVDNGANVISMSLGSTTHYQALDDAVSSAVSRNVVVVVAAGNSGPLNGTIQCPGDAAAAITIGAVDKSDAIASFSSRGPTWDGRIKPDVTNVGVNIISARANSYPGAYYTVMSGTSMATPMTAGVVALMLQRDNTLTPAQVKETLIRTSKHLGNGVSGVPNNYYGSGRVQAYNAVFNITYNGTVALNKTTFTASESAGDVIVGVQRYDDGLGSMAIDYNLSGITAVPGRDYVASNGTLSFGPGESFKTFNVTLLNDDLYEGNRLIFLNLTNPRGNSGLDSFANGTLTISENDPLPRMQFNVTNYTVVEGGVAFVNVTRANDALGTYRVHLATSDVSAHSGTDYVSVNTDIAFSQGEMFHLVPVTTSRDGLYWDREKQFRATLTTTGDGATLDTNATAYVNLTQIDPMPVIQLNATSYSMSETGGFRVINVTRTNDSINDVTINYSTSDGTARQGINYANTTSVLTFHQGEMWKLINVPVYRDNLYAGPLTFTFSLSGVGKFSLGTNKTAVITITNVDPAPLIRFESPAYSVDEKNASVNIVVTRLNDAIAPATVQYNTSDGTAMAGVNYTRTSGILTFNKGEMNHTIQVPLIESPMAEGMNATFNVTLSNPTGGAVIGIPERTIVTISNSTYSLTYSLVSGWNLISVPLNMTNNTIDGFFPASVKAEIWDLWGWNASAQKWTYYSPHPDTPFKGYEPIVTMDTGKAYWVNMNSSAAFSIQGVVPAGAPNATIPLVSNWNFVGLTGMSPVASDIMYPSAWDVWGWNASAQKWTYYSPHPDTPFKGYENLTMIRPGPGQWVNM